MNILDTIKNVKVVKASKRQLETVTENGHIKVIKNINNPDSQVTHYIVNGVRALLFSDRGCGEVLFVENQDLNVANCILR